MHVDLDGPVPGDAPKERFDADLGAGMLRPSTLLAIARRALVPDLDAGPLPDGVWAADGELTDRAAAIGATVAAPLLHVTVDRTDAGVTDRVQVRWSPTAAVAIGPVADDLTDGPQRVVSADPDAFASLVVEAMGVTARPAGPQVDDLDARRLAAAVAAGPDAPDVAGTPAARLRLITAVVVAPAPTASVEVVHPPGPRAGTSPVSRALLDGVDGLWRVEARSADATTLQLVPWAATDERGWFAQVTGGVAASFDDG